MSTNPAAILSTLVDEFELLGDWEERYRYVIELGRQLEPLTDEEHCDANKVQGCASQVWLVTTVLPGPVLKLRGDSDAHIVRGLIAILMALYSGASAQTILDFNARQALDQLGLSSALSAQRSNGLAAMVHRIRQDASDALKP